jgi:FkbM family methyltransferase
LLEIGVEERVQFWLDDEFHMELFEDVMQQRGFAMLSPHLSSRDAAGTSPGGGQPNFATWLAQLGRCKYFIAVNRWDSPGQNLAEAAIMGALVLGSPHRSNLRNLVDPFLFASSLEEVVLKIDHLEAHAGLAADLLSFTNNQLDLYDFRSSPDALQLLRRVAASVPALAAESATRCGLEWSAVNDPPAGFITYALPRTPYPTRHSPPHFMDRTSGKTSGKHARVSSKCRAVGHVPLLRHIFQPAEANEWGAAIPTDKLLQLTFAEISAAAIVASPLSPVRFVDVGSQVGLFSMLAKWWPAGKVVVDAFEPYGPSFECLRGNIEENKLSGRVRAHHAAVSSAEGWLEMNVWPANPGLNTLGIEPLRFNKSAAAVVERVRAVTLDSMFLESDLTVALIKIDVEGCECEVLKGARGILERDRPDILLEVNFQNLKQCGHSWEHLVAMLAPTYFVAAAHPSYEDFLLRHHSEGTASWRSGELGDWTPPRNLTDFLVDSETISEDDWYGFVLDRAVWYSG